jgi:Ulp1 family protease
VGGQAEAGNMEASKRKREDTCTSEEVERKRNRRNELQRVRVKNKKQMKKQKEKKIERKKQKQMDQMIERDKEKEAKKKKKRAVQTLKRYANTRCRNLRKRKAKEGEERFMMQTLTKGQEAAAIELLDSSANKDLICKIANINISSNLIRCLKSEQWLNEDICNAFLSLVKSRNDMANAATPNSAPRIYIMLTSHPCPCNPRHRFTLS